MPTCSVALTSRPGSTIGCTERRNKDVSEKDSETTKKKVQTLQRKGFRNYKEKDSEITKKKIQKLQRNRFRNYKEKGSETTKKRFVIYKEKKSNITKKKSETTKKRFRNYKEKDSETTTNYQKYNNNFKTKTEVFRLNRNPNTSYIQLRNTPQTRGYSEKKKSKTAPKRSEDWPWSSSHSAFIRIGCRASILSACGH